MRVGKERGEEVVMGSGSEGGEGEGRGSGDGEW